MKKRLSRVISNAFIRLIYGKSWLKKLEKYEAGLIPVTDLQI